MNSDGEPRHRGDKHEHEPAGFGEAATLFQSMADTSRLVILQHLQLGEHRVVDLNEHLGLSQSTVSRHLSVLREAGLVSSRPEGRASVFRLEHPEQVVAILREAERFLALTGHAVGLSQPPAGESPLASSQG